LRSGLKTPAFWLRVLVFGFLPLRAVAADLPPELACGTAGRQAELNGALPRNLLVSVGLVESGRMDEAGRARAWPWTVNVDGAGHYFADEPDAAAFAEAAESAGARDVDVGCFQISLQQHPGAFASMDAAFDPGSNADFAAGFLNVLKVQTGSWESAIADYHSARPALGLPYQQRVLAAWRQLGDAPAEMALALFTLADPTVILEGPAARRVSVITPDGAAGAGMQRGLPRVITP
jgi:hypothetical protein